MPCYPYRWIVYLDEVPDSFGRRSFEYHRLDTYFPGHPDGEHRMDVHGQCFFANPSTVVELR